MKRWIFGSLVETEAWAAHLAALGPIPGVIYLRGDLGAGKTSLARALIHSLGYVGRVRSPTYTLVEAYPTPAGMVLHLDLYRLQAAEELEFLGLRDYLERPALWLIEWPQRAEALLPKPDLELRMSILAGGEHVLQVLARTPPWQERLHQLDAGEDLS